MPNTPCKSGGTTLCSPLTGTLSCLESIGDADGDSAGCRSWYTALIHDLESKLTETPLDMHPYISGIADAASAIINLMVSQPRTFATGDQFLARYLAVALRLIEEHTGLAADYAAQGPSTGPDHPLTRSLSTLDRLLKAFKDHLRAMNTDKELDFRLTCGIRHLT